MHRIMLSTPYLVFLAGMSHNCLKPELLVCLPKPFLSLLPCINWHWWILPLNLQGRHALLALSLASPFPPGVRSVVLLPALPTSGPIFSVRIILCPGNYNSLLALFLCLSWSLLSKELSMSSSTLYTGFLPLPHPTPYPYFSKSFMGLPHPIILGAGGSLFPHQSHPLGRGTGMAIQFHDQKMTVVRGAHTGWVAQGPHPTCTLLGMALAPTSHKNVDCVYWRWRTTCLWILPLWIGTLMTPY